MIPSPAPTDLTNVIIPTQAPYYLGLFGEWLHLEGVTPGVDVSTDRATSRMVSVDGCAWEQRAPRGPRSWSLGFEWATERTVAALRVAADSPEDVWLLDRSMAVVNMLAPLDCYGTGAALLADGMPLRRLTIDRTVSTLVRRGVTSFTALWTDADEGEPVGMAYWPGGESPLVAPGGTAAQRASVEFVPDSDGPLTLVAFAGTTGLQVTEDWLPNEWMAGQRMPCRVSVSDPERTVNRMPDRSQALGTYSVTLREVG